MQAVEPQSSDAKAEEAQARKPKSLDAQKDLKPSVEELELLLHEVWGRLQDLCQTLQAATHSKLRGFVRASEAQYLTSVIPFCISGRL